MILYLCSSSGKNLELAKFLKETGESLGGEHQLIDLVALNLPLYSTVAESEGMPSQIKDLCNQMIDAKGFVYIAPEYNGSIPPVMSNSIAWISRAGGEDWRNAFNGKYAAVATHSGGGGQKVLSAMRTQLEHLGTTVIARELLTHYQKALNPDSAKAVLEQLLSLAK